MKRILLISLILIIGLSMFGCSEQQIHELNVKNNPDSYVDVKGYFIQTSDFNVTPRSGYYALDYQHYGDTSIILTEWWKDNGNVVWNPIHYKGRFVLNTNYTIVEVTISTLPKK